MTAPDSLIEVKFTHLDGWVTDEGGGVRSHFTTKQRAVNYGTELIDFHRGELRIYSENGELEDTRFQRKPQGFISPN